jgi:hypothetical protein
MVSPFSTVIFVLCGITSLYKICGVWRSVRLEAANPTNVFFCAKLIEPRANQQGKLLKSFGS